MGKGVGWSDLPEELVNVIANRSTSNIDLLRIRSICKPWRSAVAAKQHRFKHILPRLKRKKYFLSPSTFSRVTFPSSCPHKGWLIKTEEVFESKCEPRSGKVELSCPLSSSLITSSVQTLDLLKFGVSEIRQSYNVKCVECSVDRTSRQYVDDPISLYSGKVVIADNLVFAVNNQKELWWCKSGEKSNNHWTRVKNDEVEYFFDITLHKGQIYALDLKGAIWWFSLSDLEVFQFRPSTPLDYDDMDTSKDKRLVEYCGDLCVVLRFCKKIRVKGWFGADIDIERTIGFKVYKMDKELVRCVEVNTLGDKALIVATDSCFTVSASEYYGCLENAIYFNDGRDVSVLKLDDGSIITKKMVDSSTSHETCFQMFSAPFL